LRASIPNTAAPPPCAWNCRGARRESGPHGLVVPGAVEILVDEVLAPLAPERVESRHGESVAEGGFILSSSNSFHSSCKPENLIAMAEAYRELGEYPIRLPAKDAAG